MKLIKLTDSDYRLLFSAFGSAVALEKNDSMRHAICGLSARITLTTVEEKDPEDPGEEVSNKSEKQRVDPTTKQSP